MTKREQVREFIEAYQDEHGERPPLKIIMAECGIRSTRTMGKMLRRLGMRLMYVAK